MRAGGFVVDILYRFGSSGRSLTVVGSGEVIEIDLDRDLDGCADTFVAAFAADPWNEVWPAAAARQRLAEVLATPGALGLTVVREGECIGFVAGYVESFHPFDRFQLAEMAVHPDHQRRGVGSGLVQVLLDRLAARDVGEVFLVTARGESPEGFWASQSFKVSQGRTVMAHRQSRR